MRDVVYFLGYQVQQFTVISLLFLIFYLLIDHTARRTERLMHNVGLRFLGYQVQRQQQLTTFPSLFLFLYLLIIRQGCKLRDFLCGLISQSVGCEHVG
jgi:hypothetical protein